MGGIHKFDSHKIIMQILAQNFKLIIHKLYPCKPSETINQYYEISVSIEVSFKAYPQNLQLSIKMDHFR